MVELYKNYPKHGISVCIDPIYVVYIMKKGFMLMFNMCLKNLSLTQRLNDDFLGA